MVFWVAVVTLCCVTSIFTHLQDGGIMVLQNVGNLSHHYTTS